MPWSKLQQEWQSRTSVTAHTKVTDIILRRFFSICREEKKDMNSLIFRDYLYDLIKNHNLSAADLKQ
jgi:hypothetical protein